MSESKQRMIDRFYIDYGKPCCAGCDHWQWVNSLVGECAKSAPSSSDDRVALAGITGMSIDIGSGFVITERGFSCGEFIDSENMLGDKNDPQD